MCDKFEIEKNNNIAAQYYEKVIEEERKKVYYDCDKRLGETDIAKKYCRVASNIPMHFIKCLTYLDQYKLTCDHYFNLSEICDEQNPLNFTKLSTIFTDKFDKYTYEKYHIHAHELDDASDNCDNICIFNFAMIILAKLYERLGNYDIAAKYFLKRK